MPRKTDSSNPADWLLIVESDMEALRAMIEQELGYNLCRSKLAEALEKTIKAELSRTDRYPGFDLDPPNWPKLREQLRQIEALLATVRARVVPANPAQ